MRTRRYGQVQCRAPSLNGVHPQLLEVLPTRLVEPGDGYTPQDLVKSVVRLFIDDHKAITYTIYIKYQEVSSPSTAPNANSTGYRDALRRVNIPICNSFAALSGDDDDRLTERNGTDTDDGEALEQNANPINPSSINEQFRLDPTTTDSERDCMPSPALATCNSGSRHSRHASMSDS
nr:hypothetical protein BaRGS_002068 [Batillaria attramentaria]